MTTTKRQNERNNFPLCLNDNYDQRDNYDRSRLAAFTDLSLVFPLCFAAERLR